MAGIAPYRGSRAEGVLIGEGGVYLPNLIVSFDRAGGLPYSHIPPAVLSVILGHGVVLGAPAGMYAPLGFALGTWCFSMRRLGLGAGCRVLFAPRKRPDRVDGGGDVLMCSAMLRTRLLCPESEGSRLERLPLDPFDGEARISFALVRVGISWRGRESTWLAKPEKREYLYNTLDSHRLDQPEQHSLV